MTTNSLRTSNTASTSTKIGSYQRSANAVFDDYRLSNSTTLSIPNVILVATMLTSASTLPPIPIRDSSSTFGNSALYASRLVNRDSTNAIIEFSNQLRQNSKSLSISDKEALRKVLLAKSQPGTPNF
jgi:hypothetical protein